MKRYDKDSQFAVIGLGRFGMSIVETLSEYDVNILACDKIAERVHRAAEYATHAVQADAADEAAMARLGIGNFDVVVLAMGEDFEAGLLAAMTAKDLGAKYIVVKAFGPRQAKIFESIGADLIVQPELEMGSKVARRLVRPNILDILEDSEHYAVTEMRPLPEWVGRTVRDSDIRKKHGMSLLAIIREGQTIIPVQPGQVLEESDLLVALCERGSV